MKSSWLFAPLLAWVKASILISRFTREGRKILVVFPFPDRSGTVLFLTLKSSYSNSLIEWRAVGFMACYFIAVYNPYLTIEKEVSSVLSAGREQGLDWGMKLLVQDHSPFQLSFPRSEWRLAPGFVCWLAFHFDFHRTIRRLILSIRALW